MTKRLKLRGRAVKNMSLKEKKEKQKVLDRMIEARKKDDRWLRDIAVKKLEWAKKEREKGIKIIRTTQVQVYKLDGIILAYEDLLNPKKEK